MTVSVPLNELQTALYSRLSTLLSGAVYDSVPEEADPPYTVIGDFSVTDLGCKGCQFVQVDSTLHIWSEYEGMAEAQSKADTIAQSLTGSPISVSGWTVVSTDLGSFSAATEFDGLRNVRHGTLGITWRLSL